MSGFLIARKELSRSRFESSRPGSCRSEVDAVTGVAHDLHANHLAALWVLAVDVNPDLVVLLAAPGFSAGYGLGVLAPETSPPAHFASSKRLFARTAALNVFILYKHLIYAER
jgi:hypothetical protein